MRQAVVAVLGAVVASVGLGAAAALAKPNIILLLVDDMAFTDTVAIPRTKRLIGDAGATFTRAYVDVSLCCPARATLLTGRYPQNTRVYANNAPTGGLTAFRAAGNEQSTIATWLQRVGYRTAYIGKYLNGYPAGEEGGYTPPGWGHFVAPLGEPYDQYNYSLYINGTLEQHGSAPSDYAGDVYARKAQSFFNWALADDRPFMMHLGFIAPHDPATAAPRHANLYRDAQLPRPPSVPERDTSDKPSFYRVPALNAEQLRSLESGYRQRLRSLASVDEAVEGIVERLRAAGELDNTYLIFTSDNGFKLGHHNMHLKQTEFEEDIRVPLMIRGPGIRSGITVDALVSNADIAPTFADWAGTQPSRSVDGRSLKPLLAAGGEPSTWRRSLLLARRPNDGQKLGTNTRGAGIFEGVPYVIAPAYRGLRSTRYLFTEFVSGERQLYDMQVDPYQLENLAGNADVRTVETALAARAKALASCSGDECRQLENASLPGS